MGLRRPRHVSPSIAVRDSDDVLVSRAREGDLRAFEELARRHADQIYGLVRRLGLGAEDAEDVTQETFLRAWRGIAKFKGDAQFGTWLFRIGVNESKRRHGLNADALRVGSLNIGGASDPPDRRAEPHLRLVEATVSQELANAIRSLPVKYRVPLVLRDFEGLSSTEAARVLGLSEAAFKSRLHRARMAVRGVIARELDDAT